MKKGLKSPEDEENINNLEKIITEKKEGLK